MLALMKYCAELNRDIELARGETLQESGREVSNR